MKGDFSRFTWKPKKSYKTVRLQQGRVQLDADWNEQVDIDAHLRETGVGDLVGGCGAPRRGGGFAVVPAPGGDDLLITSGRIYVDGALCELDAGPAIAVTSFATNQRMRVGPGALEGSGLEIGDWVEVFSDQTLAAGTPGTYARVTNITSTGRRVDVQQSLAARQGETGVRFRRVTSYTGQPFLSPDLPADNGFYFAYLEVWERHLTALEDPEIRETALGGPDTATRTQTVAQVKLVRAGGPGDEVHCDSDPAAWREILTPPDGRMRARVRPEEASEEPCIVPASAGFTRLENQLYRVEIHLAGNLNSATFKWSRENGSVVTDWLAQSGNELTVRSTGRDRVLGLEPGDWVELIDDERELAGTRGLLVRIDTIEENVLTIDPQGQTVDINDFETHPKVRRWDMEDGAITVEQPGTNDGWIKLENGIEIFFEAGEYQTGDYWLIPARAFIGELGGDIEWPQTETGTALALHPYGIERHFCKLAVVEFAGGFTDATDCRPTFPALTELTRFFRVAGDGQEGMPGTLLPCRLAVGVTDGQWPVEGARVRFSAAAGGGTLSGDEPTAMPSEAISVTDASGWAQCAWTLPADVSPFIGANKGCLQVTAELLGPGDLPFPTPPVAFNATPSVASEVAYDGAGCDHLAEAETVQDALDALCNNAALYYVGGDGQEAEPGQQLPRPLEARVANGQWVIPGATVGFAIVDDDGSGLLEDPVTGTTGRQLPVSTGADGVAACRWTLDSTSPSQRVEARLLDTAGNAAGGPVRFNAGFVEDQDPGIHVVDVRTLVDDEPLQHESFVPVSRFLWGLRVECDRPIAEESLPGALPVVPPERPTCVVTLYLPYPLGAEARYWAPQFRFPPLLGVRPLLLAGFTEVEENLIDWRLHQNVFLQYWLQEILFQRLAESFTNVPGLLVRLTLKGNYIWDRESGEPPQLYLDGEAFGQPGDDGLNDLRLPSGDGRAGGDFDLWFWLLRDPEPPAESVEVGVEGSTVTGNVTGANQEPLPGVVVQLRAGRRSRSATTGPQGDFRFTGIEAGSYLLSVSDQTRRLSLGREVVVGTPGRVVDGVIRENLVFDPAILRAAGEEDRPVLAIDGVGDAFGGRLTEAGVAGASEVAAMDTVRLARILGISQERALTLKGNALSLYSIRGG